MTYRPFPWAGNTPLKRDKTFLNFPPSGAQEGPDAGAGGVRCCFVPMLLHGGCGYEDFRLLPVRT